MCDEWMPCVKLPLTLKKFRQIPRNAAFKYEYLEGNAYLTPRPKHYHAVLDLKPVADATLEHAWQKVEIKPFQVSKLPEMEVTFRSAFDRAQPFASLDRQTSVRAAHACLEKTLTGGDGPWIRQASFMAVAQENAMPLGAVLVTLLPPGDATRWGSYHWRKKPPRNCIRNRQGRPHLTWIFVSSIHAGQGLGTALLGAAVDALLALGYTQLFSTFLLGNDSSMLWHWRNGFQLLPYPGSMRLWREGLEKIKTLKNPEADPAETTAKKISGLDRSL